jgi:hypothetical protein
VEQILAAKSRSVWATKLDRPFDLTSPFAGEEFACLLVVRDTSITGQEQASLSELLVAQGCRYAVCIGHECSSWDTSIDTAYIATDANFDPPDSTLVMTSWHEDESIEEVAEFFFLCTCFDDFDPCRFLVLCLGGDDASFEEVRDATRIQLGLASA